MKHCLAEDKNFGAARTGLFKEKETNSTKCPPKIWSAMLDAYEKKLPSKDQAFSSLKLIHKSFKELANTIFNPLIANAAQEALLNALVLYFLPLLN